MKSSKKLGKTKNLLSGWHPKYQTTLQPIFQMQVLQQLVGELICSFPENWYPSGTLEGHQKKQRSGTWDPTGILKLGFETLAVLQQDLSAPFVYLFIYLFVYLFIYLLTVGSQFILTNTRQEKLYKQKKIMMLKYSLIKIFLLTYQ